MRKTGARFNDKLIRIENQDQLADFLSSSTIAIAQGLTGMLADTGSLKLASGRIVQAALKGNLFSQLGREIKKQRDAGEIKEDYFATHNQQATLGELLKFIDENPPDEEVFSALKSIFFCAVQKDAGVVTLKEKRKQTEHQIPVKSLPEQDRFTRLRTERKHFVDTIR